MSNEAIAPRPAKAPSNNKDKVTMRGLNFYYGQIAGVEGCHLVPL